MPKTLKFSQFIQQTSPVSGDVTVGLHAGVNTQFTNAGGGSGSISHQVMQTAHGFTVGQIVGLSGSVYILTLSDSAVDAETIGMVTQVIDANNFIVSMAGYITGLGSTAYSPMIAGDVYFLSSVTPGLLSLTQPSTPGQVSLPLFKADSPNSGWLYPYRGMVNTSGSSGGGGGGGSYPGIDGVTINDTSGDGNQLGVNLISPVFNAPLVVGNAAVGPFQSAGSGISNVGYVLTSTGSSTVPTWQSAPGMGEGLTLISSVTASNSASVNFDNMFSASYDNYLVTLESVLPQTNGVGLICQLGNGSSPTYVMAGYYSFGLGVTTIGGGGDYLLNQIGFYLNYLSGYSKSLYNAAPYCGSGSVNIFNVNSSINYQSVSTTYNYFVGSPYPTYTAFTSGGGVLQAGPAIATSVRFKMDSGNIATGTFKLYGYNN